jgi:hypothetical protein
MDSAELLGAEKLIDNGHKTFNPVRIFGVVTSFGKS